MTIERQSSLNTICDLLKPQRDAPYLAINDGIIVHTAEKNHTRVRDIYRHIIALLNEKDQHICRTIACCDDHLALLANIEQHLNFYQGNFLAKVETKTLAPLIRQFNKRFITTRAAYHDALTTIDSMKIHLQQHRFALSQTKDEIEKIFDEERVQNEKLTIEELLNGAHLALNKAINDPEWRAAKASLLQYILSIVYEATDSAQLSYNQIKPLVPLFEKLEGLFGKAVIWTTTSVQDKETEEWMEITVPTLTLLAGPSNNLLSE